MFQLQLQRLVHYQSMVKFVLTEDVVMNFLLVMEAHQNVTLWELITAAQNGVIVALVQNIVNARNV
jgi:hypothetical protein